MGGMYNISAKVMINGLHKVLPSIFIILNMSSPKRDILHNILNVEMEIDYALESKISVVAIGYWEGIW